MLDMLANNGHRATVESIPSTEMEADIERKERGVLDEIKKSMSDQVRLSMQPSKYSLTVVFRAYESPRQKLTYCEMSGTFLL